LLAQQLDNALSNAIAAGGSEPEVVRNYVTAAGKIAQAPSMKVRTGFTHQRPYAFFVKPTAIAGREKCELGDILYVYKKLDSTGGLIQAKASFVQAKKGQGHWSIEPHQLEFLANIKKIQFRFGNSVYKRGGVKPIIYNGLPHSGDLAQYLLLDTCKALSYSVKRVKACQHLYQHGFPIHAQNPILCKEAKVPLCTNHDSNLKFLDRLCTGSEGANLKGQVRNIVELIYRRIGWILDPPEEFADNFIEDPRGFAIVEITASSDQQTHES
jgi:hypothetical protein